MGNFTARLRLGQRCGNDCRGDCISAARLAAARPTLCFSSRRSQRQRLSCSCFSAIFGRAAVVLICAAICSGTFLPYAASYATANWTVVLKYPVTVSSLWEKLRVALGPGHLMELLWYVAVPFLVISAAWCVWSSRADRLSTQNQVLQFLIAVTLLSIGSYYAFLQTLSYATRPWYYLPLLCVIAEQLI